MQWRPWRHYSKTGSRSSRLPRAPRLLGLWILVWILGGFPLAAQSTGPVYLPRPEDPLGLHARFGLSQDDQAYVESLLLAGQTVRLTWRLYSLPGDSLIGVWDRMLSYDPFEEQFLVKNGDTLLYNSPELSDALRHFTDRSFLRVGVPGDYRIRVTFERYVLDPALWILSVLIPGRVEVFDQVITLGDTDGTEQ